MNGKIGVHFTLNNESQEVLVSPNVLLINLLREELGLTGTKYGCGTGECGGCSVLIDGKPALACLTLVVSLSGKEVKSIEGYAKPDGTLDSVQNAFIENRAFQCGFCTPGMVVMSKDLLDQNPNPTELEIREHLKGNICRCTGYHGIVKAVKSCGQSQQP